MASYRLGGIKATYRQKEEFIFDLLDTGHDIDVFVGYALSVLTWREVQDIGYHMVRIKGDNDKVSKELLIREIQAYDNRTDEGEINAS
jgi:hypothetical protein